MVKEISSISEFDSAISAPQLSVVDFHATWCGPCKAIAPEITRMAGTHTDVNFYKVTANMSRGASISILGDCQMREISTFF